MYLSKQVFARVHEKPLCTRPCAQAHRVRAYIAFSPSWVAVAWPPSRVSLPTVLVETHLPPGRQHFQEGSSWWREGWGCMPMWRCRNVGGQHGVGIHRVPPTPVWCCTHIKLSLHGSRWWQHLPWGWRQTIPCFSKVELSWEGKESDCGVLVLGAGRMGEGNGEMGGENPGSAEGMGQREGAEGVEPCDADTRRV